MERRIFMRKILILKTVFRTPVKSMMTILLLAAASFTLFLRVTDYMITTREAGKIKNSCYGVAALDNTVPDITVWEEFSTYISHAMTYEVDDAPWPSEKQLKKFSSLPGVTLTDTRYMTAGLVENCQRLYHQDVKFERCVIEGTYVGYEEDELSSGINTEDSIWLIFDDVTVLASEKELEEQIKIKVDLIDTNVENNPREYYEELKKGSRCLVIAGAGGSGLKMFGGKEYFRVVEGLGEDYLESEEFAYYKGIVDAINQSLYVYDIVYTSDTRAIPYFNGGGMEIANGRGLTVEDRNACIVNEFFLETYGMSIGDKITIQLGDVLFHQSCWDGTKPHSGKQVSNFVKTVDLEIVGTYRILADRAARVAESDWNYTENTIFVPGTILPIEIPADYETAKGEYSVLIEDADDIRAFREDAELSAEEMGVALIFSDGGWLDIEKSFEAAQTVSTITIILYLAGAGLALILAVYLYIGRNKKEYAIMRSLGVSELEAGKTIMLPLAILSIAMPIGGIAGFFYASKTADGVLKKLAESVSGAYVCDSAIPGWIFFICLFLELIFTMFIALIFLKRVRKIPPLELLAGQQGMGRRIVRNSKGCPKYTGKENLHPDFNFELFSSDRYETVKHSSTRENLSNKKYRAVFHVAAYTFRHIRRGIGKTAVSLLLAVVLLSGVGMFNLARITYSDAFRSVDVRGKALQFSSKSITELSKSDLLDKFYYYGNFLVYVNSFDQCVSMTFTNDLHRYLAGDCTVTYADGYDSSVLDGTGPVCLVGRNIAEKLDISPGDEISLLSYVFYSAMEHNADKEKDHLQTALKKAQIYTVAGVIESGNAGAESIFASVNYAVEQLYKGPFLIEHTEFKLSDNERLDELHMLLSQKQKVDQAQYSPRASYSVNSGKLEDMERLCNLLESLFPIAVAAAAIMGLLGSGLVILQSAKEAAFLRILGVTKRRTRCMLVFEQIILCFAGIMLVAGGLAWYSPGLFIRSSENIAVCCALYFLGCVCGACAAAVQVTRHRILELLQIKE